MISLIEQFCYQLISRSKSLNQFTFNSRLNQVVRTNQIKWMWSTGEFSSSNSIATSWTLMIKHWSITKIQMYKAKIMQKCTNAQFFLLSQNGYVLLMLVFPQPFHIQEVYSKLNKNWVKTLLKFYYRNQNISFLINTKNRRKVEFFVLLHKGSYYY